MPVGNNLRHAQRPPQRRVLPPHVCFVRCRCSGGISSLLLPYEHLLLPLFHHQCALRALFGGDDFKSTLVGGGDAAGVVQLEEDVEEEGYDGSGRSDCKASAVQG